MSTQELEEFIRTHAGVKSIKEMAKETSLHKATLHQVASRLKISLQVNEVLIRRKEIDEAISTYHKEKTIDEIAEMISVPPGTIKWRGVKLGLSFKQKRSKPILEDSPDGMFKEWKMDNWLIY